MYTNLDANNNNEISDNIDVNSYNDTCKDFNLFKIKQIVWDPKELAPNKVEEYLFALDKIWPFEEFNWSQESALQFLILNKYDIEKTKSIIKNKQNLFTDFMKDKIKSEEKFIKKEHAKKPILNRLRRSKVNFKI